MGWLYWLFLELGMWVKLFSVVILLSLNGCYSQAPKQAIIVIEKSSNLENINHQRFGKIDKVEKKTRRITDYTVIKKVHKTQKKNVAKTHKVSSSWKTPINSKVSKTYSKKHPGLTFSSHQGQEVRVIRDGKIIYIGDKMKSYGQMIIVRHPLGFNSTYTQTQSLQASLGDSVDKGQVIAMTTDQPFYFEMTKFEQTINPLKYLK